jgi:hypothetical protein
MRISLLNTVWVNFYQYNGRLAIGSKHTRKKDALEIGTKLDSYILTMRMTKEEYEKFSEAMKKHKEV